jgi:hypothetical protein
MSGHRCKSDYAHDQLEKPSEILHNQVRRFQIERRIRMVLPKIEDVPLDFDEARFGHDGAHNCSDS